MINVTQVTPERRGCRSVAMLIGREAPHARRCHQGPWSCRARLGSWVWEAMPCAPSLPRSS